MKIKIVLLVLIVALLQACGSDEEKVDSAQTASGNEEVIFDGDAPSWSGELTQRSLIYDVELFLPEDWWVNDQPYGCFYTDPERRICIYAEVSDEFNEIPNDLDQLEKTLAAFDHNFTEEAPSFARGEIAYSTELTWSEQTEDWAELLAYGEKAKAYFEEVGPLIFRRGKAKSETLSNSLDIQSATFYLPSAELGYRLITVHAYANYDYDAIYLTPILRDIVERGIHHDQSEAKR